MKLPVRKSNRLPNFDYASPHYYFLTICIQNRKCILSHIVGEDAPILPQNHLTTMGEICKKYILNINCIYENIFVDKYIIMPNHIHIILAVGGTMRASSPTVSSVIRSFKTMVTKEIGKTFFQRSFHDHVIRGQEDYLKIWNYVDGNTGKWEQDCFYSKE